MVIHICSDARELGKKAAKSAAAIINEAIRINGDARIVVSTGSSQFETLEALTREEVSWPSVTVFHLDEYIGLPESHRASFRRYIKERFASVVPLKKFYSVDTEGDIEKKIQFLTEKIREKPADLGLIGIGENGHIAFNDPPADFSTGEAYIVVNLDERCRMQQVNEGWFATLADVPLQAVTMTPGQIMRCMKIISCVPHKVKAEAVKNMLVNPVTEIVPATILKTHPDYQLFIDFNSSSAIVNMH